MMASDVDARLDAVAREIVDNRPDLVALQEASLWRVVPPGGTEPQVLHDFVQILLRHLEERGARYTVSATADGFSGGLPVEGVGLVTLLDRDVILVREGSGIDVTGTSTGTFRSRLTLTVANAPIEIVRGWAAIEAQVGRRPFRLIGTHLEAFDDAVRDQQQQELMGVVGASALPTLVLGDLNSAAQGADSRAYDETLAAGFSDAWTASSTDGTSATCCRTPDLTGGAYDERIDFVLFRGPFDALGAEVIGNDRMSRTADGLWSSDHGGVAVVLRVGA
jgi:endonuclease/exonuclease/phosphatase family metal-dependent hydrolase